MLFTFAVSIWLLWVVLWQAHRHHLLAALLLEADAGAHRLSEKKGSQFKFRLHLNTDSSIVMAKRERS